MKSRTWMWMMHSKNQFRNLPFRGISYAVTAALALAIAFMLIAVASQPAQAQTMAITSPAQTGCSAAAPCFNTLVDFDLTNGASPVYMSPAQGRDGNYYGTTINGGDLTCNAPSGCGTVFKTGTLKPLHKFAGYPTDGALPYGGLVLATDGNFYGTTAYGGTSTNCNLGCGTVFKMTPGGTPTTLHNFNGSDGEYPVAGLVQATNGNFYGTTGWGGANDECSYQGHLGCGTVFSMTSVGTLKTLYSFCSKSGCMDGQLPFAGLVQGIDGNFYGTTYTGTPTSGPSYGTVFRMTPSGTLTTLYSFCSKSGCTDGEFPIAGVLVQDTNRNLYGTTYSGGAHGYGTVFKITPGGVLTTLHSFDYTSGAYPIAGVVLATDGYLYGTASVGDNGYGGIYKLLPVVGGALTTPHKFDNTDGNDPTGGLLQATNGNFYGSTEYGGANNANHGTVFSLGVGLHPFVEALTYSGKAEQMIEILGQGLTGTTSVKFGVCQFQSRYRHIPDSRSSSGRHNRIGHRGYPQGTSG